jgi:hypothetical protein
MHEINSIPPERLSPEQRRSEVAFLLAQGLVRLRQSQLERSAKGARESGFALGFTPQQSVHTVSTNNTNRESK